MTSEMLESPGSSTPSPVSLSSQEPPSPPASASLPVEASDFAPALARASVPGAGPSGPVTTSTGPVIVTHGLEKSYRVYEKTEGLWPAIKGLFHRPSWLKVSLQPSSLSIYRGQVVGLVGANGAGKTTFLKLISGLVYPSGGDAQVLGYRPWERNYEFLRRISLLLGQKNQLWWDISPWDSFMLLGEIFGLDPISTRARVRELAETLGCAEVLNIQLRRLSLGERMKMEVIGALLHDPEVIFLDEPTIGLDVLSKKSLCDFLADYVKRRQPTVILTSHYMDDIARLTNRLLLISHGQFVYDGSVEDFMALGGAQTGPSWGREDQEKSTEQEEQDAQERGEGENFEDLIHKFLEKESGLRPSRRDHSDGV